MVTREVVAVLARDEHLHVAAAAWRAVILVVGVNGTGKTTTIGKLAIPDGSGTHGGLAASDTFRAAAGEQLEVWASGRVQPRRAERGADPGAVAFEA